MATVAPAGKMANPAWTPNSPAMMATVVTHAHKVTVASTVQGITVASKSVTRLQIYICVYICMPWILFPICVSPSCFGYYGGLHPRVRIVFKDSALIYIQRL